MRRRRRGAALIEALIAITTLVVAGVGMIGFVLQTVENVRLVTMRHAETLSAAAELHTLQLSTPTELAMRVGQSRIKCCDLLVQPLSTALYRVTLADTLTGAAILETSLYARP